MDNLVRLTKIVFVLFRCLLPYLLAMICGDLNTRYWHLCYNNFVDKGNQPPSSTHSNERGREQIGLDHSLLTV